MRAIDTRGRKLMGSKTPLYDKHVEAGARIVDFGGWDMPLNYGSQKEEHHETLAEQRMLERDAVCWFSRLVGDRPHA